MKFHRGIRVVFLGVVFFSLWGCNSLNQELKPISLTEEGLQRPSPEDLEESESNLQP